MSTPRCPACGAELATVAQSGLTLEVCKTGCGGIWFDNFEMEKVDEAHESAGAALLDLAPAARKAGGVGDKRPCPKCADSPMRRSYFSIRRQVEIDECPRCGGVWLDTGELAALRNEFKTTEERQRAADQYFDQLFNKELAAERAKSEADLKRAEKFAHALRFICPSYWIPGKQRGAAF